MELPLKLTPERLEDLIEKAQSDTMDIIGRNTPLVLQALGRQMADKPAQNEIVLKVGVTFRHMLAGKWEIGTAAEWERKVKEKDANEVRVINFDEPMLPGIVPALQNLASAIIEENEAKLDRLVDRCLCGHLRHDHRDNDGETGGCNQCVCEIFETEEDGPQAIEETKPQPELPAVTVTNEADPIGEINDLDGYAAGEPTAQQIKADLLGMFDDQPHLGRNLAKFKVAGYTVVTPLLNFEKCLLKLESGKWDLHRFDTKTACASGLKSFLDCGSIYLCDPNFKDRATNAGFHMLRSRTDGIYSKGKKGIGWCKESDARGEKAKEEMAVLAQDPKALED
jgi:hypothetical protein